MAFAQEGSNTKFEKLNKLSDDSDYLNNEETETNTEDNQSKLSNLSNKTDTEELDTIETENPPEQKKGLLTPEMEKTLDLDDSVKMYLREIGTID